MRSRTTIISAGVALILFCAWVGSTRTARAQQDPAPAALASYSQAVDNIMDLLGKGRIDDALAAIDFYKTQPDAKQTMRDRLIALDARQSHYYGYDIVSVQRFSPRLQSVSVLACYDLQPVLFHFDFYHPESGGNQPWIIPGFSMHEDVVDQLKDVPVDYHPTAR
jgi:hypothetical protein